MTFREYHDDDYDQDLLDRIDEVYSDEQKSVWANRLPTVPGKYVFDGDREHLWVLKPSGQWYDDSGATRPTRYNYILGATTKEFERVGD